MQKHKAILDKLRKTLNSERYEHSQRAEKIAVRLARKHGVSQESAAIAALLHDCARRYSRPELLSVAKKIRLKLDPIRRFEPKLFHGEIGAYIARIEFGIRSKAILQAIANHTTGRPGMSALEKIIFLADHLEEGRSFSGIGNIRRLAARDMDKAIAASASAKLKFLLAHDLPIYPATIETRNYYLAKK